MRNSQTDPTFTVSRPEDALAEPPSLENPVAFLKRTIAGSAIMTGDELKISSKGGLQTWLIDLRPVLLQREALTAVARLFWKCFEGSKPFQICGMETAAIPLLTALVLCSPPDRGAVNAFVIRKERKTTGLGRSVEGHVSDLPIVLVDDILNSSASAEKARAVLSGLGRTIDSVFVLIDYRSRKGLNWREEHELRISSLFTLDDFDLALAQPSGLAQQRYRQLWHVSVPGGFPFHVVPKSAPVFVNGMIVRGSDAGRMQAFDTGSGELVWEHIATGAAPRKGIWSTPAVYDGRLYYGAYNGVVYCLESDTGREIWTQSCCEWIGASPLIVPQHGLLYIGLEYERPWSQGSLAALDLRTGAKVWEKLTERFQHGSAAYWATGDLVVWGTADHQVVGLDASTGRVEWSFETRRSVKSAPSVDEAHGLVAFASFDKSIYLLDAATGRKRGEWPTDEICYTTPLFVDEKLFCGSGDRHLYVIDTGTNAVIAKINLGARIYGSPKLVGDRVILGTNGGKVFEIDVATLQVRGTLQLPDAITNVVEASSDGGRLFVSTYMNDLYCLERMTVDG